MKLVSNFVFSDDAEQASELLENNGIATFISSKRSTQIPMSRGGASSVGLWVVVDDQQWDAQKLLEDPNHEVERKLSETELIQVRQAVRSRDKVVVLRVLFTMLGIALIFAIVVFVFTRA